MRDICGPPLRDGQGGGQQYIVTIGIDHYKSWGRLHNAVSDAHGVTRAFEMLGFKSLRSPLLDEEATQSALWDLVTHDLARLRDGDSLVVFFAGHGWTTPLRQGDGSYQPKGFIIPVDGVGQSDVADATANQLRRAWIDIDHWLSGLQELHPRHILVILDSCHSGIAIRGATRGAIVHGNDVGTGELLWRLMSRKVITASHASQSAMDGGPVKGHSLFTGCLIQALTDSIFVRAGYSHLTGTELGAHVRRLVLDHSNQRQTPDVGTLAWDNRGEMQIPLRVTAKRPKKAEAQAEVRRVREDIARGAFESSSSDDHRIVEIVLGDELSARLQRHQAERQLGGYVLSTIATGDDADVGWATWAAQQGRYTLATSKAGVDAAIDDLLSQVPWTRALPNARARFAKAAGIELDELSASMDARSDFQRESWIRRVSRNDPHLRVCGWFVAAMHERYADVISLETAPLQGIELFAVACDLAAPISILVQPAVVTADDAAEAIHTAARLVEYLPNHPVSVSVPQALLPPVLHGPHDSDALSMARQGLVDATRLRIEPSQRTRHTTTELLWNALERDPRTAKHFTLGARVRIDEETKYLDVALIAPRTQLIVEIDGWYRQQQFDVEAYRRDRRRDLQLQRAGFFVLRVLGEDIEQRLESQVEDIAVLLHTRVAAQSHGRNAYDTANYTF